MIFSLVDINNFWMFAPQRWGFQEVSLGSGGHGQISWRQNLSRGGLLWLRRVLLVKNGKCWLINLILIWQPTDFDFAYVFEMNQILYGLAILHA